MAVEQIPKRDKPLTRFIISIPFLLSTVALIFTFLFAPYLLLSSDLEVQPLYTVFLIAVPIMYIIAILSYAMKRAITAESLIESLLIKSQGENEVNFRTDFEHNK